MFLLVVLAGCGGVEPSVVVIGADGEPADSVHLELAPSPTFDLDWQSEHLELELVNAVEWQVVRPGGQLGSRWHKVEPLFYYDPDNPDEPLERFEAFDILQVRSMGPPGEWAVVARSATGDTDTWKFTVAVRVVWPKPGLAHDEPMLPGAHQATFLRNQCLAASGAHDDCEEAWVGAWRADRQREGRSGEPIDAYLACLSDVGVYWAGSQRNCLEEWDAALRAARRAAVPLAVGGADAWLEELGCRSAAKRLMLPGEVCDSDHDDLTDERYRCINDARQRGGWDDDCYMNSLPSQAEWLPKLSAVAVEWHMCVAGATNGYTAETQTACHERAARECDARTNPSTCAQQVLSWSEKIAAIDECHLDAEWRGSPAESCWDTHYRCMEEVTRAVLEVRANAFEGMTSDRIWAAVTAAVVERCAA